MRSWLAVVALALCLAGGAAAAAARSAAEPLQAQEWWLAAIGADTVTPPGPGVPLTIVDSGVDPTHPEFAGRPDTTFLDPQTVFGREEYHGTIVASLAAAPVNGAGIAGVYPGAALQAWDSSADARGISDSAAVSGILAAAGRCPGVINLSFGGVVDDPQLHEAVLTAVRNGCLVVAASGNSGQEGNPATYPAQWPHVLTVGATDENDQVAPFSTVGPGVDLVAPGVDMVGAVPLWRSSSGYLDGLAGTSFSAPLVSAAAAWVWTARPTLSASQLAEVLRTSARDVGAPGFDTASGWGVVNVAAALQAPTPAPDPFEPNDDVEQVKPGLLFETGEPALTTPAKPSTRVAGTLDSAEDPRDLYRIWVPANKVVRVSVSAAGRAAARIWGPRTASVAEGVQARRRDLRGTIFRAGKKGVAAYVEVLLTGSSVRTGYVLAVTAARR